MATGLSAALVWQAGQSRVTPFVVEVDRFGETRAVAPPIQNYQPTDTQIAWHLGQFIAHVRGLSTDPVLVRRDWLTAYDFASDRSAKFLDDYARSADPFGQIGVRSVMVQIASVVRASDSSFQVKWNEQAFERGSPAGTTRWTAMLTVILRPPHSEEALRRNPLGLFVTAIDWSRESDPPPPTSPERKSP